MKLILTLCHVGEETGESFTVELGEITWGSVKSLVMPVARAACAARCQTYREGDVRTGEIREVVLTMTFGNYYGSAFVLVKELVAKLQEQAAGTEAEAKGRSLPEPVRRRVDAGMSLRDAWTQAG